MTRVGLPDRDDYYLALAFAASRRANCRGRKVGAVLVKGDRVIATGYNGTPEGLPNCWTVAACVAPIATSSSRARVRPVHLRPRRGQRLAHRRPLRRLDRRVERLHNRSAVLLVRKELIQAGVVKVYYARTWAPDPRVADDYRKLQARLAAEHVPTEYEIVTVD